MLHCENQTDRSSRADARRRHLLETARALFQTNGFHGTGMAQIAAASGVKIGQIYRDFPGKEAIIAAIAEEDVTAWLEEDRLADAVERADADAIRAWIARFGGCDVPDGKCRMMAEVFAESARNPRIAEIYRAVDARVRASLTAAIQALVPPGCRCPEGVALVAEFILATKSGVMSRRVINPDLSVEGLGRLVADILNRELDKVAG